LIYIYIFIGQDLNIEVASLGLSIDEEAVTRLTPFLEILSKEINSSPPPMDALIVQKDVTIMPKVVASIYPIGKETCKYFKCTCITLTPNQTLTSCTLSTIGMLITVSIRSVALSLMRALKEPIQRSVSVSKQLETAFTIKIMDLYAKIDMRKYNLADAKLRSFTITDCRQVSEKYAYREMLCNSTVGSQHDSTTKPARYFYHFCIRICVYMY
jgi:hypothetical protein